MQIGDFMLARSEFDAQDGEYFYKRKKEQRAEKINKEASPRWAGLLSIQEYIRLV